MFDRWSVRLQFALRWGFAFDREEVTLYLFLLPFLGLRIHRHRWGFGANRCRRCWEVRW